MQQNKPQKPTFRFILPPARFIQGDMTKLQMNDMQGKPKEHPNLFFGLAVPKFSPDPMNPQVNLMDPIISGIWGFGHQVWGHHQIAIQEAGRGFIKGPNFAWKIQDGDAPGEPEVAKGCWIFKFGTILVPLKCADINNIPMDPAAFYLGCWVDVAASVSSNENSQKPGIYMNPDAVRFLGHGERVQSGASVASLFGGQTGRVPVGASANPVAPAHAPGGGQMATPGMLPPPQSAPVQQYAPPPAQQQQYAPPVQQPQQGTYQPQQPTTYPAPGQPSQYAAPAPQQQYQPPVQQPQGNVLPPPGAPVQGVPAGATAYPAQHTGQPGSPGTVSPSNQQPYQPHPGYLTPQG